MILCDWEITSKCGGGMVTPFEQELVNPASLDVRLGDTLLIESVQGPELVPYPLGNHTQDSPYMLGPGQFLLGQTMEVFNLPCNVAAEFRLKSSRAREGLDQALAVWCDPGWSGSVLTVEIRNNRQLHAIPLWPGMRIGQMIFHRMSSAPINDYLVTGRYNGDKSVTASKG